MNSLKKFIEKNMIENMIEEHHPQDLEYSG